MLGTHDCANCAKAGKCPLEHLAPVINEHITSIEEALVSEVALLADFCTRVVLENPIFILKMDEIADVARLAFGVGYAKALQ